MAEKLSRLLGISEEVLLQHDLKLTVGEFCHGLLKDQKQAIGRVDGRFVAPSISQDMESENDPSMMTLDIQFATAVNDYLTRELGLQTDRFYNPINYELTWSYDLDNEVLSQRDTIYKALSRNSFLKIWVLCGYYDLATPFYAAEWGFDHIPLQEEQVSKIQFTYYPCGHMIYLDR